MRVSAPHQREVLQPLDARTMPPGERRTGTGDPADPVKDVKEEGRAPVEIDKGNRSRNAAISRFQLLCGAPKKRIVLLSVLLSFKRERERAYISCIICFQSKDIQSHRVDSTIYRCCGTQ